MKILAEATLVLVLFSDVSRAGLGQLRADMGMCLLLFQIGINRRNSVSAIHVHNDVSACRSFFRHLDITARAHTA